MKKLIFALLLCFSVTSYAQFYPKGPITEKLTQKDSLMLHLMFRMNQKAAPAFEMYATDNMWTFLELDTATGRIWQVQYSASNSSNAFSVPLNSISLPEYSTMSDTFSGRYKLYKTQNIYNFILLDTATGASWQVQWSQDVNKRGIIPINPLY